MNLTCFLCKSGSSLVDGVPYIDAKSYECCRCATMVTVGEWEGYDRSSYCRRGGLDGCDKAVTCYLCKCWADMFFRRNSPEFGGFEELNEGEFQLESFDSPLQTMSSAYTLVSKNGFNTVIISTDEKYAYFYYSQINDPNERTLMPVPEFLGSLLASRAWLSKH